MIFGILLVLLIIGGLTWWLGSIYWAMRVDLLLATVFVVSYFWARARGAHTREAEEIMREKTEKIKKELEIP